MSPALVLVLLLSAGQPDGRGATGCWRSCQRHVREPALRARVRGLLETRVLAEWVAEAPAREETLACLTAARVLLEAMAGRPEASDEAATAALLAVAETQGTSVGGRLPREAKPADQALINRLFAVYSRALEALGTRTPTSSTWRGGAWSGSASARREGLARSSCRLPGGTGMV